MYKLGHQTKHWQREKYIYFFPTAFIWCSLLQKCNTGWSILQFFLLCLERNHSQIFKCNSCKKCFIRCLCSWYNLLRSMFLKLCDNWKTLFFIRAYCYSEFLSNTVFFCALKQVFWKKAILSLLSLQ